MPTTRRDLRRFLPALLVAGAALVFYANALHDGFVFDDQILLVESSALARPEPLSVWFWRDYFYGTQLFHYFNYYRPLTMFSHVVNFRLTGLTPWSFHLVNILLHAGVSLLVWAVGRRLVGEGAALAGALIFAVHPLHTEAVTGVVGRAEILAALFALGAILCFLWATEADSRHPVEWTIGAIASFALALLSKEHVVTLPAWFALVWLIDRKRRSPSRMAVILGALILTLLAYLALRAAVLHPLGEAHHPYVQLDNPAYGVSIPRRWLTAAAVTFRYAWLFLWPQSLSADYSYAQILASQGLGVMEAGGFLLIGALLWAILYAWRRAPGLALALTFIPVTFLVVSNFPFRIGGIMAERLTYLPSVGVCLLAGWALARFDGPGGPLAKLAGTNTEEGPKSEWRERFGMRGAAITLLVCATLALGMRTFIRNEDWRDQYTLFWAAYEVSPKSFKVLGTLAQEESRRGNQARARALFEEARGIIWDGFLHDPDFALAALAFGKRTLELGRPVQAAALFEAVLQKSPNDQEALLGMAQAALMQGKREEAKVYARRAASLGARLPPELAAQLGLPDQ